ncbi:MAG: cytochrome c biogenesis protein CcsA [Deltaproteobacteria bacterium]|nr:cytochrome c biogenesis protein CcsA [Deltaproteobacteria bacterium]
MKWLGWSSLAAMAGVGVWVFGFTPEDTNMGFVQKIFYIHIPSVVAAYLAAFLVALGSLGYLWKREAPYDRLARSSGELATLFFGMVLATGAIWGRPTWGTYWTWDPRLTSALMAFLLYAGYGLLRAFAPPGEKQARLAAVLGLVAFLDIPLIHLSVQWWRTLHQPTTFFKVDQQGRPTPAADPEIYLPLFGAIGAALLLFAFLLVFRMKIQAREEDLAERLAGHETLS